MTLAVRRGTIIAVVLAVITTIALLDGSLGRPAAPVAAASQQATATAVVPAGAGSSSWFCAGGSGPGAGAEETVVLTNPTTRAVTGTVTAVASTGLRRSVTVHVAPGGITTVVPAQLAPGPWVTAEVLLAGAGIGVDETVSTPLGWSEAPCASSTAPRWYFTGGSTAGSDGVNLSIFNPTATAAVVDTTMVTSRGQVLKPAAYQGVTVGPGALVTQYLSDHDEGDPSVSVTVSAVTGSVVAAQLQSFTSAGAQGVALQLGAPQASSTWAFADTERIAGGQVAFHLYDPGRRSAHVTMTVHFAQGAATPIPITVPAGGSTILQTSAQSRVPVGTVYTVTFRSTGAPVVVSRDVTAPAGGASPQRGLVLGTALGASRWLVPPITAPGTVPWSFAVQNVAGHPVQVTVEAVSGTGMAAVSGFSHVTVATGGVLVATGSAPAPIGTVPLVVDASGPVAVALDPEPVGSPGVVEVPALPLG